MAPSLASPSGTWTQTGDESPDNGTWTLENNAVPVTQGCTGSSCTATNFTVNGSDTPPPDRLQREKQDGGSPEEAKVCETPRGQIHFNAAEAAGRAIVLDWYARGFTTAAYLLNYFLGGTGVEVDYRDTSDVAAEIKESPFFKKMNDEVVAYIVQQAADGTTQIQVPTSKQLLHTLGFTGDSPTSEADLHWALRYTHGITLEGNGSVNDGEYKGSLTYVISESYGFNTQNKFSFLGIEFGTAMRYLQTTCGAPYYPGGAQWFPLTITLTVPFDAQDA